jgi:hypothetical protein
MNTIHKTILAALVAAVCLPVSHSAPAAERQRAWHGGDIRHFETRDMGHWRDGRWRNGWHDGRLGWWWVVGGFWYFYPEPIYPYPDPYTPPVVMQQAPPTVVIQQAPNGATQAPAPAPAPASAPAPTAQAPQVWHYCEASKSYYPYVASCPGGWKQVPAAPADAPQR